MSELQDIIASMIYPCEYVGGPWAGVKKNSMASPYVVLPDEDGCYVLVSEEGDRLIYEWRIP